MFRVGNTDKIAAETCCCGIDVYRSSCGYDDECPMCGREVWWVPAADTLEEFVEIHKLETIWQLVNYTENKFSDYYY